MCAGLARHLGVDVAIVRILTVVITVVTSGVGLVAYVAGLMVIPSDDGDGPSEPVAHDTGRDTTFWLGVTLLIVGAAVLLAGPFASGNMLHGVAGRDMVVALVLIAFGLALWRSGDWPNGTAATGARRLSNQEQEMRMMDGNRPVDGPVDGSVDDAVGDDVSDDVSEDVGDARMMRVGPGDFTPPPVPGASRSLLGRTGFGLALVTVGVLWLLRTAGVLDVGAGQIVAAGLLVVGLALVVAAFAGRARGLIWLGLLLAPIVLVAELLRPVAFGPLPAWDLSDGAGDVTARPATVDELATGFRLGVGRYVVDLGDVDLEGGEASGPASVSVELGVGELVIVLPDGVTATVEGRVGIGELNLGPYRTGGLGLSHTETIVTGDGTNELVIDAQLGVGELRVVEHMDRVEEAAGSGQEDYR